MNTSTNNGKKRRRRLFRLGHRWLGVAVVVFVVMLSVSGIALNHSSDIGLDKRFVSWGWLLDAYGMDAPTPTVSFADAGHRATLLGNRLFVDGQEIEQLARTLTGLFALDSMLVIGGEDEVMLLTSSGKMVESMDLRTHLPGPIQRIGRHNDRAVLQSGGILFRSNTDVSTFAQWDSESFDDVSWSVATPIGAIELAATETAYRGRGLSIERVILDLHSGRIFSSHGAILMDFVAVLLIGLSMTGLFLSFSRNRRQNGFRQQEEKG